MNMDMNMSQSGMFLTTDINVVILFNGCIPSSTGQYVVAWFITFLIAIMYELINNIKISWEQTISKKRLQSHPLWTFQKDELINACIRGAFSFVLNGILFILMLIVMTFQIGLYFAIITGFGLGSFLFGAMDLWPKISMKSIDLPDSPWIKLVPLYVLPRMIYLIYFIVLLTWIFNAEGGIGFTSTNLFGFHALLMSFFIILFMTESILSFHNPFVTDLSWRRVLHIGFQICGLFSGVCGLVAIVYYKQLAPPLNGSNQYFPYYTLYSGHSWSALLFIFLWLMQIVFKLIHIPTQFHKFIGKLVYIIGLAVCALGFQSMQSSDLASSTYPNMNMSMMNMTGYLPDSVLAQSANACIFLIVFLGIFTHLIFEFSTEAKPNIELSSVQTTSTCCEKCAC